MTSSFITSVPDTSAKCSSDLFEYKRTQHLNHLLNLYSIEKGADSFELRISTINSGYVRYDTPFSSLIQVKYSNNQWIMNYIIGWPEADIRSQTLDSSKIISLNKRIGATSFLDSLALFELDSLRSRCQIPGYINRTSHPTTINIEIATEKKYLFVTGLCHYWGNDVYSKRMAELLNFLSRHGLYSDPICGF